MSINSVCQLKCIGKTACKDPVSTGHSCAGFRVSGMLTAFWTACTLLWQAKSYYPTWDSPVALLKPSNMLSFKCVCVLVCVASWEGQRVIQYIYCVSKQLCLSVLAWGFSVSYSLCDYTLFAPLLPCSALLIPHFITSPQKASAVLPQTQCLDELIWLPLSLFFTNTKKVHST